MYPLSRLILDMDKGVKTKEEIIDDRMNGSRMVYSESPLFGTNNPKNPYTLVNFPNFSMVK